MLHGFPYWVNWFFGFVEIETFGFFFMYARDVLISFLKISALTHLPLVRGFLWLLGACAPADLQVLAVWLIDMLVMPPGLLMAFLV
jgi:hypothetical protein